MRELPSRNVLVAGLLLLVFGLFSPVAVQAQGLYGSIVGTITDQSGAVIPGAQVTATNDHTQLTRQATTNAAGQYRILDVPFGTYSVEVSAPGFKAFKATNVGVQTGQVTNEDLKLELGAVSQEVTVEASGVALQTQKADVHATITAHAIQNLPLNVYRNFQTIELLTPGVFSDSAIRNSYPNSINDTPDRSLKINANGLPQHINTTRVDGATNIFIWLPDHMLITPPQETIQEVNVQTSNFDVEKGLTAGVATDVITRSGTNSFHGNAYGYHTNSHLNAKNLFNTDPGRPKYIVNNDGATLGGPIKKNKLFFFGNWDGAFQRTTRNGFRTIAPDAWRTGDFSDVLGAPLFKTDGSPITVCTTDGGTTQLRQGMVFDPSTGDKATGMNRCAFSSGGKLNVIPANRLNAGTQAFWKLLRSPNRVNGPLLNTTANNDYFSSIQAWNRNVYTGKIDWNRNDRHTIWGKYTAQSALTNEPAEYGEAGGGGSGIGTQMAQTATIGHSWTATPKLVVTGHVGWLRMGEDATPAGYGKPLGQTLLGIKGANEPIDDVRYSGLPGIAMSGFSTLGTNVEWEPVFRNDWTLTIDQNATYIRGNHEIRFGFNAAHNHLNHWQPEIVCCPRGNLNFSQGITGLNLPGDPNDPKFKQMDVYTKDASGQLVKAGSGAGTQKQNSAAAFDVGVFSQAQKSEQLIKSTGKDWQTALYIGDRWKVTPNFTADIGLRWEYYPIMTRDGAIRLERYDAATNQLFLGGLGGNPADLGIKVSKKLFAPRLGLAYRMGDKMVIRSGIGMTYDTLPLERPLRGFYPLAIGQSEFIPSSSVSGYLPVGDFAKGISLIQRPDINKGILTPPGNVEIGTLGSGEFKRGYLISWNLFVQRKLPKDFILDVGYVGNHFVHEFNGTDINAAPLGAGSAGQPLAAYKRFGQTNIFNGNLDSHYNALQVMLNRQFKGGLYVQGSYTWDKAIAYVDDTGWRNGLRFSCPASPAMPNGCIGLNRGVPNFDHSHMFKMASVYELPFGTGKRFANTNPAARAILGGWQLNGVVSAWNGSPLTISGSSSKVSFNTPGSSQNADFTGTLTMPHGTGPGQFWFDPKSFTPPGEDGVLDFGSAGRGLSWLRGPGLFNVDLSLARHFKPTERFDFEVRLETQNVTNTPHWNNPGTSCSYNAGACGGSLGQITGTYGERIVQLGAKLSF